MGQYKAKTIISGNMIEVYEYQYPVFTGRKRKDNSYPSKIKKIIDEKIELESKEIKNRSIASMVRTRNKIRRLLLANFDKNSTFVTLTFDPKQFEDFQLFDPEFCSEYFSLFVKRLSYKLGKPFKYIAVTEFHKSGRIHYHMICNVLNRQIIFDAWGAGLVDVKLIDHVDNVGAYVVKYMTKIEGVPKSMHFKRLYFRSIKNLKEEIVKYYHDLVLLQGLSSHYTSIYESDIFGNVKYTEYRINLKT